MRNLRGRTGRRQGAPAPPQAEVSASFLDLGRIRQYSGIMITVL